MQCGHEKKGATKEQVADRLTQMSEAFPDALVNNYEPLIEGLILPDPKDRHVMAAAIKTNANLIVSNNVKDFPKDYLAAHGLAVKNVDDFLTDIIDLNHDRAIEAFKEMVLHRTNPDLDEYQVLDQLRHNNLNDTANYLHSLI